VPTWFQITNLLCPEFGLEFRMIKFYGKNVEKYDQEEMALLEEQAEYKAKVTECLQETTISSDDDHDTRWNKVTCVIHKTAVEVFGKTSRKQLKDWYGTECQEAAKVKNEA